MIIIINKQFNNNNLLKLRTSYRLFTKVKSNKVIVSSGYELELIFHYVVRSGQSAFELSTAYDLLLMHENGAALERI